MKTMRRMRKDSRKRLGVVAGGVLALEVVVAIFATS
jgi:hypothetical protein